MTAGQHAGDTRHASGLTRTERLDRLSFNAEHGRLLVGSGLGWALDAMDVGLISFVMAALAVQWELTATQVGLALSIGSAGMAVGASLGGVLADKIGRRTVFSLTLLVYGLATGASALTTGLTFFLVLRFIVGLGLGAELPVASTLVSEFAPARIRGRVIVILEAFWALGWLAAAVIGNVVVACSENGWRWALAIGALPALYALYVRSRMPESVRFLESQGRHREAEEAVATFEDAARPGDAGHAPGAGHTVGATRAPRDGGASPQTSAQPRAGITALFAPELRVRTIALWVCWFGLNFAYYGAFQWLPTLLTQEGTSLTRSFEYVLIITLAQLPGYAVAAILIETWGRRATLVTFLLGSGVAAAFFAQAAEPWQIVAAGCVLSFFCLGAWGALYAVTPETYPTSVRGTGAGWAAGFGRIASIIAPLTVPALLTQGGRGLVFAVFAAAFVVAALGATLLAEKKGQTLDE